MTAYPKPNTSPDYRASAQECLDRAQRSLEVAEVCLENISAELNRLAGSPQGVRPEHVIAHAEARTRLGTAWGELGEIKATLLWPQDVDL